MALLAGVHHVSLNVTDAEEAARFYEETLGLTRRDDRPDLGIGGLWLDAGDTQIHLIEVAKPPEQAGQHFAFLVDDLDAARVELIDRGVEVSDVIPLADVCRQAFFHDPSGNLIELNQPNR